MMYVRGGRTFSTKGQALNPVAPRAPESASSQLSPAMPSEGRQTRRVRSWWAQIWAADPAALRGPRR